MLILGLLLLKYVIFLYLDGIWVIISELYKKTPDLKKIKVSVFY